MNKPIKYIIYLVIIASLMAIGHFRRKNNRQPATDNHFTIEFAERIKIDGLKDALLKLQNGKTAYHFTGITSNGTDCIYFYYEESLFNVEFEAVAEDQLPYMAKLESFAEANGIAYKLTSYKDKTSHQTVPVIRLQVNASADEASRLGEHIQKEVFGNDENTVYEVVP